MKNLLILLSLCVFFSCAETVSIETHNKLKKEFIELKKVLTDHESLQKICGDDLAKVILEKQVSQDSLELCLSKKEIYKRERNECEESRLELIKSTTSNSVLYQRLLNKKSELGTVVSIKEMHAEIIKDLGVQLDHVQILGFLRTAPETDALKVLENWLPYGKHIAYEEELREDIQFLENTLKDRNVEK